MLLNIFIISASRQEFPQVSITTFHCMFFNIILSKSFSFPKGIEVKIQLTPNDPKICIDSFESGAAYKLKIDSVKLHIPVAQVGQLSK